MMCQRPDVALPVIPLDLWSHKRSITIHWTIILIANCILPITLYFSLKKYTSLHTELILSIILPIIGLPALATLFKRFVRLYRNEDARPTTSRSRWAFDFFQWNFTVGVIYITIVLVLGSTSANVRLVALMIPLSILQTCTQLVLTEVLFLAKLAIPFPLSSFEAGSRFPPGVIVIAEDICAVDGGCGREFRSALVRRITSSPALENVSRQLDWMWGISGLLVAGTLLAVIFGAENPEIGYALSFTVPWAWAAILSVITVVLVRRALNLEATVQDCDTVDNGIPGLGEVSKSTTDRVELRETV